MINSKQHGVQNSEPWDPWQASDEKKNPWRTSRGCRVQNSGPWDPWLPVVENSRLFEQRTVRPLNQIYYALLAHLREGVQWVRDIMATRFYISSPPGLRCTAINNPRRLLWLSSR